MPLLLTEQTGALTEQRLRMLARGLSAAVSILWIAMAAAGAGLFAGLPADPNASSSPAPGAEANGPTCPFCLAPEPSEDFCPRCGRLSRLTSITARHRFWTDVPYLLAFPPLDTIPEITSEFSPQGLVRESVVLTTGDRYQLTSDTKGLRVSGRVGISGGKEMGFAAEMEESFDDQQRISARRIVGKVDGKPDVYLHRRVDYLYSEFGRLDRIQFKTWFYGDSSAWMKKPAAWLRHAAGETLLRRPDGGLLTEVETIIREGKRSLRGDPEYGSPRTMIERVTRIGDRVDQVSRVGP